MPPFEPAWFLSQEARALATRLDRLKPFVLQETMVPAAALLPDAQVGIERALTKGQRELRKAIDQFLIWIDGPGQEAPPAMAQRRFTNLRMAFNAHLSELEVFSDAITQRSESELGVWLSGLDVAAADGLTTPGGDFYDLPPIICYVDRGHGAAIRRIHTRLPAGSRNPVGIIRIPRERMVGHGIASSLLHEVGHQGGALLDLVASLRTELDARKAGARDPSEKLAWHCWRTWISEIAADFWSVAKLGVGVDPRIARCRQPAPPARIPGHAARPASVPVDPGQGLSRHRPASVPARPMGRARAALGAAVSPPGRLRPRPNRSSPPWNRPFRSWRVSSPTIDHGCSEG